MVFTGEVMINNNTNVIKWRTVSDKMIIRFKKMKGSIVFEENIEPKTMINNFFIALNIFKVSLCIPSRSS